MAGDQTAKPQAPVREVVASFTKNKRIMELTLSCGHRIKRRLATPPQRVACPKCPRAVQR